jgi:hypothetical protein
MPEGITSESEEEKEKRRGISKHTYILNSKGSQESKYFKYNL